MAGWFIKSSKVKKRDFGNYPSGLAAIEMVGVAVEIAL
jgi:hypothetical protein